MDDNTTPRPWVAVPMGFNVSKSGVIISTAGAEIHPYADVVAKVGVIGPQRTADQVWADASLIVRAVNAYDAHQELVNLCTGILECLDQGDQWKKPARMHAAGLLRAVLAKARTNDA